MDDDKSDPVEGSFWKAFEAVLELSGQCQSMTSADAVLDAIRKKLLGRPTVPRVDIADGGSRALAQHLIQIDKRKEMLIGWLASTGRFDGRQLAKFYGAEEAFFEAVESGMVFFDKPYARKIGLYRD